MRQIKFRMWNKEIKEMYDVGLINFQQRLIFMKHYEGYTQSSFALEDVELMQYTGLKDKNGKEIYTGDIIKSYYYIDTPYGEQERYNQKVINYNDVLCEYNINAFENLEVIGNLYENPELLERSGNGD